jgi:hypothetical protein
MCCLVRAIAHLVGGDRLVRGDGGMMITRVNKKNSEKDLLQCHFVHH